MGALTRLARWRPPLNFVTLHYAYIILAGLLAFPILYPQGNLSAIDAYHFGASASTESGLNTVDVKDLQTYQQVYLYLIPIITNLGFINIAVVVVRLWWFEKHLNKSGVEIARAKRRAAAFSDDGDGNERGQVVNEELRVDTAGPNDDSSASAPITRGKPESSSQNQNTLPAQEEPKDDPTDTKGHHGSNTHITFDPSADQHPRNDETLYVPGPRDRDNGKPVVGLNQKPPMSDDDDDLEIESTLGPGSPANASLRHRGRGDGARLSQARSIDRVTSVASSVFVIGANKPHHERRLSEASKKQPALNNMPFLSKEATVGRNSEFHNLTSEDREALGGIEYRSLKLLLKIVLSYFFGLHLFGVICLLPWIKRADAKYKDYLAECGQGEVWWAFYSAQTMVDNLGFTLTPDSMIQFRDAQWPMFIMSFLAYAGNTFYPIFLRLVIWTMSKLFPKHSRIQEPLDFLLTHPRRCYTLLFPSHPTWILFTILFVLNFVDTLLIIVLDLHNPEVAALPVGQRILAAIFQSASSRHTGTSSFMLSDVNPAVQFSLLVMMYISIFPIAISIRASNTYEEKALGIYERETELDDHKDGKTYLLKHMQNQLSFDLWYIFLGIFCIAIAEAPRIMDNADPAFNLFAIFFEVTSAYGNVGLSLGHPTANVSLCGKFTTFGKFVICVMMIRGRHRGLPYQLDRAIMLPDERLTRYPEDNVGTEESSK